MFHVQDNLAWVNFAKRAKLKAHWASRCVANLGKRHDKSLDCASFNIGR
jgi:hypothetical protein